MSPVLTLVGSLPPPPAVSDKVLRGAVELQRAHGIRLFTDGEPRGDMLSLYTSIPGIGEGPGLPQVVGRIRPMEHPDEFPKIPDLDRLRALFPDAKFKVCLTGPSTFLLATASRGAGPAYRGPMDPALHDDLTEALRPIAREIGRRGAFLQVDEPVLSQGMKDYGPSLRRLDLLASETARDRTSIHVCGGLVKSKAWDALLRLERISVLNIAFAGRVERENLALLTPGPWREHDLRLGAGCADVQVSEPDQIMDARVIEALLRDIRDRVGGENLAFVLPDCGMRATARELVEPILASLHEAFTRVFPEAR